VPVRIDEFAAADAEGVESGGLSMGHGGRVPSSLMSNEQTFLDLIATWEHGSRIFNQRVPELFTHDCKWIQPGQPTTTGPKEAIALADGMEQVGISGIRVIVLAVGSSADGNTVFTERIDEIVGPEGTLIGSVPVAGVTEFRDGKICSWREYFDTAALVLPS